MHESGGIRGEVIITAYPAGTHLRMAPHISRYKRLSKTWPEGAVLAKKGIDAMYRHVQIGEPYRQKNLIMQAANLGMDLIVQRLCSSNTYSLNIAHAEIGTGTLVATLTDSALQLPTARTITATAIDSGNNQAQLQFFFPDNILDPTSTVTITIASPGVVTWNNHGLVNGCIVQFTTTGTLPTGITAATPYYVVKMTTNTFQISLTNGGASINTSGSQSGTQTGSCTSIILSEFGCFVDGSSSIGTGQLFNHALFAAPYTKSAGTDITVGVNITISQ